MKRSYISHITLLRLLLYVGSVAVILWLMPRQSNRAYRYELGKPWTYGLLTAPADMPIYPDTITAQRISDSIISEFVPVFHRDVNHEKTALADYAKQVNEATDINLSPSQRNKLIGALRGLLDRGIVEQDVYAMTVDGRLPFVRFVTDHTAITVPTQRFLSAREAYASLDSMVAGAQFRTAIERTGLSRYLSPNVTIDSVTSSRLLDEVMQKALAPTGVIQQGERIIDRGDIVTPELYTLLRTYESVSSHHAASQIDAHHYPVVGQALYVMVAVGVLYLFLFYFRHRIFSNARAMVFVMVMLVTFTIFAYFMSQNFRSGIYMVPFTIVSILMVVFFDGRTAFVVFVAEILLSAFVATFPFEFFFVQMVAGLTAISSMKELTRRSQLVRAACFVFVAYVVSYVAVDVMQTGSIEKLSMRMIGFFAINAVLISFTYMTVFVIEKVFGFTSSVTLVELSDVNNSLLRELSEKCPGTFQHSMQVSNLASEAAHRVGADEQLVRTGALYHDIGKVGSPAFFTENQHGVNPHDALSPDQSARIIINHVTEGIKRAERAKLPTVISDFIVQHHGTGRAKYFYNTYCNAHPDEVVDAKPFTYPGPNPQSREASILMMADAVEASSRSLKEHTSEAITALVNNIIDGQIADGLHNESPISFRDVNLIKQSFIERLRTMYHVRVSYPSINKHPQ